MLPANVRLLAGRQSGALTAAQIRGLVGERAVRNALRDGLLVRLWQGCYAVPATTVPPLSPPRPGRTDRIPTADHGVPPEIPLRTRLMAAEFTLGRSVTACLPTAAEIYGFALADDPRTHVVGDSRSTLGTLVVHRTPPVGVVRPWGRFAVVEAAETAIRLAGQAQDAPRTLAVLDAALRSQATTRPELLTMSAQASRRSDRRRPRPGGTG